MAAVPREDEDEAAAVAVALLVWRERGRDGWWSSTPALLYTRQREISAWDI